MKSSIFILSTFLSFVVCQHQQQIDPAYLQQYYAQVAQAAGARAAGNAIDATPIFEQDNAANQQPQYLAQGQQLRVKDNVAAQVRAQSQPAYLAPQVRQYQPQVQYISQHQHQPSPSPPPQQEQQHLQYRPQQQNKQTLALTRRPQSEYQSAPQQHRLQKPQQHHQQQQQGEIEEEEYESNPSYQFGFDVKDDEFTNYQNRKEVRDGNVIKGSYSVVDSDGFIRTVTYTADPKEGFKAEVVREPTDIVVKIPTQPPQTHSLKSHQHQQPQYVQQQQQPQQQHHSSSSQYHRSPQQQNQQQSINHQPQQHQQHQQEYQQYQ